MTVKNGGRCEKKASPVFVAREKFCRFGHVQVQICRPFGKKYKPFPTSFWLVCPFLTKRAGTLESLGGVHELENCIKSRGLLHEWRRYNIEHQIFRLKLCGTAEGKFLRRYRARIYRDVMRGGVGGIRVGCGVNVKCLHLQAASLIGIGHHPAEEWLKSKGLCGDCECNFCGKC